MQGAQLVRVLVAVNLLFAATPLAPATRTDDVVLTGTVSQGPAGPIGAANVTVMELGAGVATDAAGRYRITLPAAQRGKQVTVRVRAIGYKPESRRILLASDTTKADFTLQRDALRLEQVIVTGTVASANITSGDPGRDLRGEEYARIVDNPFRTPRDAPRSTFGVDVDRASYSNVRRIISVDHQRPPVDAVRIEELINYFPYDYDGPAGAHPFAVRADVAAAPWAPEHLLVRVGLQARNISFEDSPANNLVFLIDVSGSMQSADKLPLLKQAFRMLVQQLREQDRVAIVVYASQEGLALPSTSGVDKRRILDAIDDLSAGGSTAGGAGIRLAYDVAKQHFIRDGNNRVILATDGDFNVGVTDNGDLERYIAQRREEGTALTVLGFGAENIRDNRMEMLADKGNGNYAYIDSPAEARKVLVHEMGGTLLTVAKDVKLQVEFNPAVVAAYRLIGYENRVLADADFKNDKKDAGDMGAGHSVTALYEIIPVDASDAWRAGTPDTLRYSRTALAPAAPRLLPTAARNSNELMYVRFRYKKPTDSTSIPFELVVPNRVTAATEDFRFAQAVAAFGMVLRNSEYKGSASPALALELAQGALGRDVMGYRADFVNLIGRYNALPEVRTSALDRR